MSPAQAAPSYASLTRKHAALHEQQVCEAALVATREGYDAMALGCFFDPGLQAARSLTDMPIAFADVHPFKKLGLTDRPALLLGMDADPVTRNALRHGLCTPYACLDGECAAASSTQASMDNSRLVRDSRV